MAYNPSSARETSAAEPEPDTTDAEPSRRPSRRRPKRVLATVYDATAGRVTYDKTHRPSDIDSPSSSPSPFPEAPPTHDPAATDPDAEEEEELPPPPSRPSRSTVRLAPEDVLFRRKDAPVRYAEHDIYRAHERDLPGYGRGVLPASDLLSAVNSYAGQFYAACALQRAYQQQPRQQNVDARSMDETALLAFGILLEEAGREVLGRSGHLVFTEPDSWDEQRRGDGDGDGDGDEDEASEDRQDGRGGMRTALESGGGGLASVPVPIGDEDWNGDGHEDENADTEAEAEAEVEAEAKGEMKGGRERDEGDGDRDGDGDGVGDRAGSRHKRRKLDGR